MPPPDALQDNGKAKGIIYMAPDKRFTEIAERTRLRVQRVIAETAGEAGSLTEPEVAALVWAQLSGAITAVANGLAGLLTHGAASGFTFEQHVKALHDQFDGALAQAMLMKSSANDK